MDEVYELRKDLIEGVMYSGITFTKFMLEYDNLDNLILSITIDDRILGFYNYPFYLSMEMVKKKNGLFIKY